MWVRAGLRGVSVVETSNDGRNLSDLVLHLLDEFVVLINEFFFEAHRLTRGEEDNDGDPADGEEFGECRQDKPHIVAARLISMGDNECAIDDDRTDIDRWGD